MEQSVEELLETLPKKRVKKRVTAYRCNLKTEDCTAHWHIYRQVNYRHDGKPLKEIVYSENGEPRAEIRYRYQGNLLMNKETLYPQKNQTEKYLYTYDRAGRQIEQVKLQNGKLYDRFSRHYNEEGLLLETVHFDEDNIAFEKEIFTYENGKKVKEIHLNEENEPEVEILLEYDEKGLPVREINNHILEKTAELTRFEYDGNGNRVYSETIDLDGQLSGTVRIEYDRYGNAIKYISETFGIAPSKMINQVGYDAEGRPVLNEFYDVRSGRMIVREEVKYNADGDMIEEDLFEADADELSEETHYLLQMAYEYYA